MKIILVICILMIMSCRNVNRSEQDLLFSCSNTILENSEESQYLYFVIDICNRTKEDIQFECASELTKDVFGVSKSYFVLQNLDQELPLFTSLNFKTVIKKESTLKNIFFLRIDTLKLNVENLNDLSIRYIGDLKLLDKNFNLKKTTIKRINHSLNFEEAVQLMEGEKVN